MEPSLSVESTILTTTEIFASEGNIGSCRSSGFATPHQDGAINALGGRHFMTRLVSLDPSGQS